MSHQANYWRVTGRFVHRPIDIQHAADVADALCTAGVSDLRLQGLRFLLGAVPESKRAEVVSTGGVDAASEMLRSDDPQEVENAVEVATCSRTRCRPTR